MSSSSDDDVPLVKSKMNGGKDTLFDLAFALSVRVGSKQSLDL